VWGRDMYVSACNLSSIEVHVAQSGPSFSMSLYNPPGLFPVVT